MSIHRLTGEHKGYLDGDIAIALFDHPMGLALSEDGLLYVADPGNHRVRCIHLNDGEVTTVLGNGLTEGAMEGEPSPMTPLHAPHGVIVSPWGELHVCETGNHRVWRLVSAGWAEIVAGNGSAGYTGDGNPARSAQLNHPHDIAFDDDGVLYIADFDNNLIRAVSPDGWISSLGEPGSPQLKGPTAVCPDGQGGLYIADSGNHRIMRFDLGEMTMTTITGAGQPGFGGDGGPATEAHISDPVALCLEPDGGLLIADRGNGRVRRVDANGIIQTIISPDQMPKSDDGSSISLSPTSLAIAEDGRLYISDDANHCIWVCDDSLAPRP